MKNTKYILLLFVMLLSSISCTDYLDRAPTADLDVESTFSEMRLVTMYHDGLYDHVQSGRQEFLPGDDSAVGNTNWGYDMLSEMDGYFLSPHSWGSVNEILAGAWITSNRNDEEGTWGSGLAVGYKWRRLYEAIRAVNIFLDNWTTIPESEIDDPNEITQMVGEAKFLRGFFYLQLVQRWGGVPIIDRTLDVNEDLRFPRNTMQECLDFIVNDFNEAAQALELEPRGGTTWAGRATKGAAMALKARAIMWGASQYWSAHDVDYTWEEAAEACMDVINLNHYELFDDYRTLLFDQDAFGTEHIFWQNSGYLQCWGFIWYVNTLFNGVCSVSPMSPTQEFVDCYEIYDPATGEYVMFNRDNSDHLENIYNKERRDPRFDQTVIYNGSVHQGVTVQTYTGGNLAPTNASLFYTGYNYKRWISEDIITGGSGSGTVLMNWSFIRYTDILLMYAEAQNHVSGPNSSCTNGTMTALEALNKVRQRAGITDLSTSISSEDFDTRLRNERSVEFPCEDIRFFDIRRWDIGQVAWDTPHGAKITKNTDGSLSFDFTNTVGVTRSRFSVDDQSVLYPIHHEELQRNPNLVQNPGWTDIYRP